MWLIHFLPIGFMLIVVHGIVLLGLIGILASFASKFIPGIGTYALPIRLVSTVIILLGVYLEGVVGTHQWYQEQAKQMQAQVAASEEKSKELNTELTEAIAKDTKTITNHTETVHEEIHEKLVPIDKDCSLDPLVISILNHSATNPLAAPAPATTPAPQGDKK